MNMAQELRKKLGVEPPDQIPLEMKYGHDNTHVVLIINQKVDNLRLTLEQLDDMMGALKSLRKAFIKHGEVK